MYRFSYAEVLEDAPDLARARERDAFDRALDRLHEAERLGAGAGEARDSAVLGVQELWNVLISDLLNPENALAPALRADLVTIGMWNMREAMEALREPGHSLAGLITVNTAIRDGLQ